MAFVLMPPVKRFAGSLFVLALASACTTPGPAPGEAPPSTTPAPPAPSPAAATPPATQAASGPLAPFAWLAGCWKGNVNQREFREMWLPLAGGTLVGAGQQASQGRLQDYEFLRIEARDGGVFFSQFSGDRKEVSFRLDSTKTDGNDTIFTFANTAPSFPARLIYRKGTEGWLYETIEGALSGAQRNVIYPMRRVSCESGDLITQ